MRYTSGEVAAYYDHNTPRFLRWGQGGASGALHRAVWAPEVRTRDQAFDYVPRRVLDLIRRESPPVETVLDLGCGVGGTLEYLLRRAPIHGIGVANSRLQIEAAGRRLQRYGERAELVCADFCSSSLRLEADLCLALESFVQAADAARFLSQVAGWLRPGGRFVLCDDVVAGGREKETASLLEEIRRGWRMSSLLEMASLEELASGAGLRLESDEDLTPYLELDRPRDRALELLFCPLRRTRAATWALRDPRWGSLAGGAALRRALKLGWIRYRLSIWRRS